MARPVKARRHELGGGCGPRGAAPLTTGPELPLLDPTRLAQRVDDRFRASASDGSRHALESREEVVDDGGVRFVVSVLRARAAPGAQRKPLAPRGEGAALAGTRGASPFLPPYDPGLLVGAITPTHVCLLNKYNIVDRHLLIVTRAFEDQESPLTPADLDAALVGLEALDGVVFYNSGPAAGASQSHKHLQLVPYPLGPGGERFPLDRLLAAALASGLERIAELGVRHRLVSLRSPIAAAEVYRDLVAGFDLEREAGRRTAPYNLLMTREWMLLVPRAQAACGAIEVNALGFAGALVARGEEDLERIRRVGPRRVLRHVAFAE